MAAYQTAAMQVKKLKGSRTEEPNSDLLSKLPEELIILILSKLPAGIKPLLQLLCVSKLFKSIISQPCFLDLHLSTCTPTPNQKQSLFIGYTVFPGKFYLLHPVIHSGRILSSSALVPSNSSYSVDYKVVGSTKGLVCLFNWDLSWKSFSLTLWNPSIDKSQKLPLLPDLHDIRKGAMHCYNIVLGFAFDHKSADFKVVMILYDGDHPGTRNGGYLAKVLVYAEKRKSWSSIAQLVLPCYIVGTDDYFFHKSVSVDEIAYWLAKKELDGENDCIMGFDFVNEVFKEVELPRDVSMQSGNLRLRLFSLVDEKSLALFVSRVGRGPRGRRYHHSQDWSIWVMYPGSKSNSKYWEKRYNFKNNSFPVLPLGMVSDRHLLASVFMNDRCCLIDFESQDMEFLEHGDLPLFNSIIGYVPSLAGVTYV